MEELLVYLIVIAIVIWIVYLVVVYIIAPISGVLGAIALSAGMLYALWISSSGFIRSMLLHKNPYTTYVDKHREAAVGVKRNYFFGPGYHQISITIHDAFQNQSNSISSVKEWWTGFRGKHIGQWYIKIWADIFYFAAWICTYVFGSVWTAIFSVILFSVIAVGVAGFYVFFGILWLSDRIALMARSIQSRCPNCKRISIVPVFCCSECGTQHVNLTPGPYGVLSVKCGCGHKLPTTIFSGRSRLEALCPYCQTPLAASDAKQFGIQLVGGVSAGKTTFLTAYWHLYLEQLRHDGELEYECFPQELFNVLEDWFWRGTSDATSERNANMYSVVHKRKDSQPCQMTIYDVAGEAFEDLTGDIQQQQLKYCEGIIFVVDPTATPEANSVPVSGFDSEFKKMRGVHASKLSDIPVSVVISKADLFKREIGLPKIKSLYAAETRVQDAESGCSLEEVRDRICRSFLMKHGYAAVLNAIDSEFANLRFFSASAIGHEACEGEPYDPWGVMEPVERIIAQSGVQL